ncbi:MAG TPA: hypothetical protein DD415_01220 [Clostridiales bacterium]|nr:hypothetical protein [Clostridiales bacterium]
MEFTNEANTHIETLILGCDESILSVDFLNDYKIEGINIDDYRYKRQISDGMGRLLFHYDKRLNPIRDNVYFRLFKDRKDLITITMEPYKQYSIPNKDMLVKMGEIKESEERYIYRVVNLLRIFKHGYVGIKHIFLEQEIEFGMKYSYNDMILNENRSAVNKDYFALSKDEIVSCNQFVKDNYTVIYDAMENIIDIFNFALDQIGIETEFEKLISALETMLLKKGEQGKKEVLAKRVAVMVGKDDYDISKIYSEMKEFYKYRSESTHEGKYANINNANRKELEELTRAVIKKYFEICQAKLLTCPTIIWDDIKRENIITVKSKVTAKQPLF